MTLKENITELFVCVAFDFFCCQQILWKTKRRKYSDLIYAFN